MEPWRQRLHRHGGAISCRANCPVHMSCTGTIRARSAAELENAEPIDGHVPLAQCDTCAALFGFEFAALRYLEHPLSWKQSPHQGKAPGIP